MQGTALGHRLETLQDGLTTFRNGVQAPMPLLRTEIDIRVMAGLAIVRTIRSFRNAEDAPIEAILTFPVGFDAVVTGLAATIDGRRMLGIPPPNAWSQRLLVISGSAPKVSLAADQPAEHLAYHHARAVILVRIGYDDPAWGLSIERLQVIEAISRQSAEIAFGVDGAETGAGDQGIMFGYACNETPELMPLPIMLAHQLMRAHHSLRRSEVGSGLGPDAKA